MPKPSLLRYFLRLFYHPPAGSGRSAGIYGSSSILEVNNLDSDASGVRNAQTDEGLFFYSSGDSALNLAEDPTNNLALADGPVTDGPVNNDLVAETVVDSEFFNNRLENSLEEQQVFQVGEDAHRAADERMRELSEEMAEKINDIVQKAVGKKG